SCTRATGSSRGRVVDAARTRARAAPVRALPLHLEAEPLQLALVVSPVLAHLDPELEMHALAEQLTQLLARERAGLLEDAAGLADDDLLLALALEPDQRVDEPLALLVLAEVRDLDGQAVRHFLVNERHELFANRLRNPKAEVAVRDHALRELLRPDGQAREDLLDEALEVFSAARGDRDELREPLGRELRQRRQQLDAAREVVDLVQHEERSVELAVEHLDQRMVLARELAGLDDEQRQIAIFERLMDLPRHEPMQCALRPPRVPRRVDEDGLIGPTIQHAE